MKQTKYILIIILLSSILLGTGDTYAEIIDRVAAFVDDEVITLRELDKQYNILHAKDITITKDIALNTMINQLLIEKDAIRRRIIGMNKDETVIKYINLYIRSQVRIKQDEITDYYKENIENLKNNKIEDIRDDIEKILIEKQVNIKVRELLYELKSKSNIKIYQLKAARMPNENPNTDK
jgi:hypothetical protein